MPQDFGIESPHCCGRKATTGWTVQNGCHVLGDRMHGTPKGWMDINVQEEPIGTRGTLQRGNGLVGGGGPIAGGV